MLRSAVYSCSNSSTICWKSSLNRRGLQHFRRFAEAQRHTGQRDYRTKNREPVAVPRVERGALYQRVRSLQQGALLARRFRDDAWNDNEVFDFIKQSYVLVTRWADDLVRRADELEPHDRDKAQFYLRQVSAALSPSIKSAQVWNVRLPRILPHEQMSQITCC